MAKWNGLFHLLFPVNPAIGPVHPADHWVLENAVLVPKFVLYYTEKLAVWIPSTRGHTESGISNVVRMAVSLVVGNGHWHSDR